MTALSESQAALIAQAALVDDQTLIHRASYPLDRFLWLKSQPLDALVARLLEEINTTHTGRKRPADSEEKLGFFVKLLLVNLLMLQKLPRKVLLALPKGAGDYTVKDRYSQRLLSYATMRDAYDRLLVLGYIEESKGFWDAVKQMGRVTRVDAAPKLLRELDALFPQEVVIFTRHPNEETIYHKDDYKKYIEYRDTAYSDAARDNLKIINACLSRHWYDLEMTEEQFEVFNAKLARGHDRDEKKSPVVNFTARSLYRVFNGGSAKHPKQNFQLGGRFYGGWWEQIPSDYRRYLTINQKYTVELDYSNLHPHMLYAKEGMKLEGDAYAIDGIPRDMCKLAFSKLLNGKKRLSVPDDFDEAKMGMSWKQVLGKVEARHAAISKYFRTGYGLNLQRIDADIMEKVLLHFSQRDIPCLPIHDSIIIHHDLADELKAIMLREYHNALGQEVGIKLDNNYDFFVEHYPYRGEDTTPIEVILAGIQQSQHERRWLSWSEQNR